MGSKSLVDKPVNVPVIKKEAPDFDMKDYAENSVKEVLGWYGFDGRDCGGSSSESEEEAEPPRASSPRRDRSKDPHSPSPHQSIPAGFMCCTWCQKVGSAKQFSLKSPNGNKAFCSEQCFTQSRRANFKRNKTCDWCRHVRHTVNYVDFQDGEHQLQFCSDKCLNQYKMNIFCTETQAHLDVHPHPSGAGDAGVVDAGASASASEEVETPAEDAGSALITPDLWMRDCRSPQSPETDKSATPPRIPSPLVEIKMSPSRSRYHPQKIVLGDKRKCKRSPKRSAVLDQRRSSYSPPSPSTGSPPGSVNINMNMRVPPTGFHPAAMFQESQRPIFFSPAILTSPPLSDGRFPHGRHPLRKVLHPQMPPLLPLGPVFPAVFPASLVPPPVTIVPYPILLPIPIPIPIPIPLPGITIADLIAQLESAKKTDDPSKTPQKPESTNNSATNDKRKQENTNPSENQTSNNQSGSQKHPPRKRKHVIPLQDHDSIKKSKTINS